MNMEMKIFTKLCLKGKRNRDVLLDTERMTDNQNIIEIIDRSSPAYDFEKLYAENEDTILEDIWSVFADAGRAV